MCNLLLSAKIRHTGEVVVPMKLAGRALSFRVPPPFAFQLREKSIRQGSARWARFSLSTWPPFDRWQGHVCRALSPFGRFMRPGSKIGQHRYLSICVTKGFPTSANFESNLPVRDLTWSTKNGTSQTLVNLTVISVPRCTGSIAKTLGLKHLNFPDTGAGGGRPDGERVVHRRTDELLIPERRF